MPHTPESMRLPDEAYPLGDPIKREAAKPAPAAEVWQPIASQPGYSRSSVTGAVRADSLPMAPGLIAGKPMVPAPAKTFGEFMAEHYAKLLLPIGMPGVNRSPAPTGWLVKAPMVADNVKQPAERPVKWAMERKAHAAGLRIEYLSKWFGKWMPCSYAPSFDLNAELRIATGQEKAAHEAGIPVQWRGVPVGGWWDYQPGETFEEKLEHRIKPTEEAQ